MHRFANPARFMRASQIALPWLAGVTILLLAVGLVLSLIVAPPDYQQGETRADHVRPCAGGLDGDVRLYQPGGGQRRGADLAPSAGRDRGQGDGPDRRRLHRPVPGHRLALGPADVGHLVGVGRAADLGAGAVLPLSRLHGAAARLRRSDRGAARRRDPGAGRRSSTCRSSSSRSTGGTRCTSRRACCASAARRSIRRCCCRCWSWAWPSPCCS